MQDRGKLDQEIDTDIEIELKLDLEVWPSNTSREFIESYSYQKCNYLCNNAAILPPTLSMFWEYVRPECK